MGKLERFLRIHPAGRSFGGIVAVDPTAPCSSASPIAAQECPRLPLPAVFSSRTSPSRQFYDSRPR